MVITIWVNGESHKLGVNLSVTELLQELKLNPRMVALEYNGEILHREYWSKTTVAEGDRFEVVTMVGGG